MSRNGYEMDDEKSDPRTSEPEVSSPGLSADASATGRAQAQSSGRARNRKSRAPKADASSPKVEGQAKKKGGRKSTAPRSSRAPAPVQARQGAGDEATPRAVVVDLAAGVVTPITTGSKSSRIGSAKGDPDLISIPPADLDEHDERFFAEGEAASQRGDHLEPVRGARGGVARHAQVSHADLFEQPRMPVVPPERRKRLANYVKGAVVVSSILCVAAIARVALRSADHGISERSAPAAQVVQIPAPLPAPVLEEKAPVAEPVAPVAAEPVAPAVPLKSAHEEREDARHALESGKLTDAVDAATRSITVDPTDAEAWLLLGAAQQDLGHGGDAHASFVECTKRAKSGNVGECRAMLSWNGPPR